jgi:hypothetical protein
MTTRRSRPPRSRKSRTTEPPQSQTDAALLPVQHSLDALAGALPDPSETAQLRALEAGWDELLS